VTSSCASVVQATLRREFQLDPLTYSTSAAG
jgi:hypothetical protein